MDRCFAALRMLAVVGVLAAGCGREPSRSRVVAVAAAADLSQALPAIVRDFRLRHPEIDVQPTFGASGTLHAQISNGAPFDLYLAADIAYPRSLAEKGLAEPDAVFRYGTGRLVVWVPDASAVDLDDRGADALIEPTIRRIAIANPRHAPYGRAAEAALEHLGLREKLAEKIIFAANVAEAAQFVQSGAADAAIIALALAESPAMKPHGRFWLIPADAHPPLVHGGVVLAAARNPEAAQLFADFLMAAEGRAILRSHGFDVGAE
jgi:molybdate transport system substrate-binding protein